MKIYGDFELYRKERRNGTVPTFQEFVRYLVSLDEWVRKTCTHHPKNWYLEKSTMDENNLKLISLHWSGRRTITKPQCDEEEDKRDQRALETCLSQLCSM